MTIAGLNDGLSGMGFVQWVRETWQKIQEGHVGDAIPSWFPRDLLLPAELEGGHFVASGDTMSFEDRLASVFAAYDPPAGSPDGDNLTEAAQAWLDGGEDDDVMADIVERFFPDIMAKAEALDEDDMDEDDDYPEGGHADQKWEELAAGVRARADGMRTDA